jgi:hypothetical protein
MYGQLQHVRICPVGAIRRLWERALEPHRRLEVINAVCAHFQAQEVVQRWLTSLCSMFSALGCTSCGMRSGRGGELSGSGPASGSVPKDAHRFVVLRDREGPLNR